MFIVELGLTDKMVGSLAGVSAVGILLTSNHFDKAVFGPAGLELSGCVSNSDVLPSCLGLLCGQG